LKIKKVLLFLYNNNLVRNNIVNKRLEYRIEVTNVTIFANAKAKIYYNVQHTLLILKLANCVYLRLNYNYYLFDKFNKKILF